MATRAGFLLALPAFLALASCAGPVVAPAPGERPADAASPGPATTTAAPQDAPGFPAPDALPEGDRWFVALRPESGREPQAERHRRRRSGGLLVEEVTWGRSFAALAAAEHGTAQVFAVSLDGAGLSVSLVDEKDAVAGPPRLELAAPFRVGTIWTVEGPGGVIEGRIEALEPVETPSGKIPALRVVHRGGGSGAMAMTTWYDAGLRPVRSEIRRGGGRGEILETRAALASPAPSPEECRGAVEWAKKSLAR